MVDGDCNTKFFHQLANRRRNFNAIHKIKVDGEPFIDAATVKNAIIHFYENLYQEDQPSRCFLNGIVFASISLDEARDHSEVFTEDEISNAIFKLGNEKALGPDGFDLAFSALLEYYKGGDYVIFCRLS